MSDNDANHVVVDGSNIAFEGREQPSLRQLDEAVRAFLAEHPHDVLTVVVDATFAHRIDESEKAEYEAAVENGEVITPPAGAIGRVDAFVLEIAERTNATVLSNDSFQEFHGEHSWLFDDGRLIGGKPIPEVGWVFVERSPVRGPASRHAVQDAKKAKRRQDGGSGDDGSSKGGRNGNQGKGSGSGGGRGRSRSSGGGARGGSARGGGQKGGGSKGDGGKNGGQKGGGSKGDGGRNGGQKGGGSKGDGGRRTGGAQSGRSGKPSGKVKALAEEHPVGSRLTATVTSFASHGAHLDVDGVQCYLPLSAMADPAPNAAREVLDEGEEVEVIVDGVNPDFGNLDLALPGFESDEARAAAPTASGRSGVGSQGKSGDGDRASTNDDRQQGRRKRRWFGKKD